MTAPPSSQSRTAIWELSCIGTAGRYITVDRFSSAEAWHRLVDEHGARYAEIDRLAEATTSSEPELIAFDQL